MDVVSLKKRKDFLSIRNSSLKAGSPAFLIQAQEKTVDPSACRTPQVRFGLVVTKKMGNSVMRNRLKRRLRALTKEALKGTTTEKSFDFVYVARPGLAQFGFQDMVSLVRDFLLSHHLLTPEKTAALKTNSTGIPQDPQGKTQSRDQGSPQETI